MTTASLSKFKPTSEDIVYKQYFEALSLLFDGNEPSEELVLLLSTCRNQFLTLNALFVQLKFILGRGLWQSQLTLLANSLGKMEFEKARTVYEKVSFLLDEYRVKATVWEKRYQLKDNLDHRLGNFEQADEIRLILENVRTGDGAGHNWSRSYYELNLQEDGWIKLKFDKLNQVNQKLISVLLLTKTVIKLGESLRLLADARSLVEKAQEELFSKGTNVETASKLHSDVESLQLKIISIAKTMAESLWGSAHENDNFFEYAQVHRIPKSVQSPNNVHLMFEIVDQIIRESEIRVREILSSEFRSNIAPPPLPPPFEINLQFPGPAVISGLASALPIITRLGRSESVQKIVVAIGCFPVPVSYFDRNNFRFRDEVRKEIAEISLGFFREACKRASESGANAIFLPEYFIIDENLNAFFEVAEKSRLVLIGGCEGHWSRAGRLINRAVIKFPDAEPLFQNKQRPSTYEPVSELFEQDTGIQIFSETGIGNFAVVVCSDFLEFDVLSTIANSEVAPHTIFVSSYNPHPEIFESAAMADSIRLVSHVIIANTRSPVETRANSDGSCAFSPTLADRKVKCESLALNCEGLPNADSPKLHLASLNIGDIDAAKNNNRPPPGFLNIPRSRRPR